MKNNNEKSISALYDLVMAFEKVEKLWSEDEEVSNFLNDCECYPFDKSFDELTDDVKNWFYKVRTSSLEKQFNEYLEREEAEKQIAEYLGVNVIDSSYEDVKKLQNEFDVNDVVELYHTCGNDWNEAIHTYMTKHDICHID